MTTYPPAIPTPGAADPAAEGMALCGVCGSEAAPDEAVCDHCMRAAEIAETEGEQHD